MRAAATSRCHKTQFTLTGTERACAYIATLGRPSAAKLYKHKSTKPAAAASRLRMLVGPS